VVDELHGPPWPKNFVHDILKQSLGSGRSNALLLRRPIITPDRSNNTVGWSGTSCLSRWPQLASPRPSRCCLRSRWSKGRRFLVDDDEPGTFFATLKA
jgi:hypothetical protein